MTSRDAWVRASGLTFAVIILALALLGNAILIVLGVAAARERERSVDSTRAALIVVNHVRADVGEAQAGVDGYLISGDVSERSLYLEARARLTDDLAQLATLSGLVPGAKSAVAQIQQLMPVALADMQDVMNLEQSGQGSLAMQKLSAGHVAQEVGALRGVIAQVDAAEDAVLRNQVTSADMSQQILSVVLVVTMLMDVISFVAILYLVRRSSVLREQYAGERARAEAQAQLLALEESNRRMDEFLSVASHEIRTPLTSLKISLQLSVRELRRALEESERGDGVSGGRGGAALTGVAPLLERAMASTERLERLAGELLDTTRMRAGALELRPTALALESIVKDCVEEQRLYAPDRIIIVKEPPDAVIVLADDERVRQVVTNYLSNALKFSKEVSPVSVEVAAEADKAMVRVRDEGVGIPPEEQGRIWERFYRAPGITHKAGSSEGLGLGLYLCKSVIEQLGGEVGVESVVGKGSTFWFTLPLVVGAGPQPEPQLAQGDAGE